MKNSNQTNKEENKTKYKVINREAFVNRLLELAREKMNADDKTTKAEIRVWLSEELGYTDEAIAKWFCYKNVPNDLERIIKYFEIDAEDLIKFGIIDNEKDNELQLKLKGKFIERLNECLTQKGWKKKDLTEKMGIPTSTRSAWFDEKSTTMPFTATAKRIAKVFDIPWLYLIGETDVKKLEDDQMATELNLTKNSIDTLKVDGPEEMLNFDGLKIKSEEVFRNTFDIKNYLLENSEFLDELKRAVNLVFSYYNYDDFYESFEELLNTVDIGSQDWTIFKRFSIERMAHDLISDKLCEIFDKYIEDNIEKNKRSITEHNRRFFHNEETKLNERKIQVEKERKKADDEIKRIDKRLKEIQEMPKDRKNKKQQ